MKSPIARGLRAASRLVEWAHRRIHGPKYAPGDVVEWGNRKVTLEAHNGADRWWSTAGHVLREEDIIRVVRYGEGEVRANEAEARVAELEAERTALLANLNEAMRKLEESESESESHEARAEKAEEALWNRPARLALVEELELQVEELEEEVCALTPPEGHVAVMLPREDVEMYASDDSTYGDGPPGIGRFTTVARVRLNEASRKALEKDDE